MNPLALLGAKNLLKKPKENVKKSQEDKTIMLEITLG
jgi:hypothetical protein